MTDQLNPTVSHTRDIEWITTSRLLWLALIAVCMGCGLALLVFPPVYVVAAVGAIFCTMALFFFPFLGALAYLVFEYALISAMFPVLAPLQVGKLLMVAVFVSWFTNGLVTGNLRLVSDRVNWVMLGWVAMAFATIVLALRSDAALEGAVNLAKWFATMLLFIHLVTSVQKWHWFIWIFLLLNLKLSQFQLRSYSFGLQAAADKDYFITAGAGAGSVSFLANATDFGAAMCVAVPLAICMARYAKWKPLRILSLVSAGFFIMSIVRTGSRGAAVALFAMAVVYWWKSRRKAPVAVAVVGLVIAVWTIAPPAWQARFISAKNYNEDATASSRLDFWKAGLVMFAAHPLTGVGISNFPANYAAVTGIAIAPHSIFIQAASELGLPGISILLGLIVIVFRRNGASRRLAAEQERSDLGAFADALDVSLVGYMVSGAFLSILYYPHLFMILAMTIALNQIVKNNVPALDAIKPHSTQAIPVAQPR